MTGTGTTGMDDGTIGGGDGGVHVRCDRYASGAVRVAVTSRRERMNVRSFLG
jgi:hypothetical protein